MSKRAKVVAEIPIAGPLTMAIRSFGYPISKLMNFLIKFK